MIIIIVLTKMFSVFLSYSTIRRAMGPCLACVILLVLILRAEAQTGSLCPPTGHGKPSCVCKHPKGVIDLEPLSKQGSPMFTNAVDPKGFSYDYNPCSTFSDTAACTDVYICQSSDTDKYPVADKGTEQIFFDNDDIYVYYSSPTTDGNLREAKVHLKCNLNLTTGNEVFTTEGDSVSLLYDFTLSSCHACPGGCSGGGGPKPTIAGPIGIVIIFLMIIALVAYFIIGAVIMKVHFKAEGSDIIPNKGFWFSLPVMIKDGFMFTISPCLKLKRGSDYEKM